MNRGIFLVLMLACAGVVHADVFTFTGTLNPATNPNLTYWNQYLPGYTPPVGGPSDWERAFNIAVHTFSIATPGPVSFSSSGYGLGGIDPVLSLFSGTGESAAWVGQGYGAPIPTDYSFTLHLAAGIHTLAISVFDSEPCASGPCWVNGTFGDGFTNLVNYDAGASLLYNVQVDTDAAAVPEPSTLALLAGVAAAIAWQRSRRARPER